MEQELKDNKLKDEVTAHSAVETHSARHESGCVEADFYSCEEAVKRLNEYLDHEMTPEERVVVLKHLEICRPCLNRFSFEQTLVVSLREKVSTLSIPPALREKLFLLLREEE